MLIGRAPPSRSPRPDRRADSHLRTLRRDQQPVTTGPGASSYPYLYTGQYYANYLKLYDYKARLYDPRMGRFYQSDPIGTKDDLNLYQYTHGDPLDHGDPTGLAPGIPPEEAAIARDEAPATARGAERSEGAQEGKATAAAERDAYGMQRNADAVAAVVEKVVAVVDAVANEFKSLTSSTPVGAQVKTPANSSRDFVRLRGGGKVGEKQLQEGFFRKVEPITLVLKEENIRPASSRVLLQLIVLKLQFLAVKRGGCVLKKDGC